MEDSKQQQQQFHDTSTAAPSKASDVEYDDEDYNEVDYFKGVASMAQQQERAEPKEEEKTSQLRDYSIDLWNGSPGLRHWEYNDNDENRQVMTHFTHIAQLL